MISVSVCPKTRTGGGSPRPRSRRTTRRSIKSEYGHYKLRRGRTLPEGFTIVKVCE